MTIPELIKALQAGYDQRVIFGEFNRTPLMYNKGTGATTALVQWVKTVRPAKLLVVGPDKRWRDIREPGYHWVRDLSFQSLLRGIKPDFAILDCPVSDWSWVKGSTSRRHTRLDTEPGGSQDRTQRDP